MFSVKNAHVWDFWLFREGEELHLFYLTAPHLSDDPEDRHARASVGHALSTNDGQDWTDLPPALLPRETTGFDDRTIWTGSVAKRPDGGYAMLYTGTSKAEGSETQRIGLAFSDDLISWKKEDAPVISHDPALYLGHHPGHHNERAWRDPYILPDTSGKGWLAYVTAQNRGEKYAGCVALARSDNLRDWRVEGPVTAPGQFFLMEIPQVTKIGDRYVLLVNVVEDWIDPAGRAPFLAGTHMYISDRADGNFTYAGPLLAQKGTAYFGAKLYRAKDGLKAIAWRGYQPDGTFGGDISDPFDVTLEKGLPVIVGLT